MAEKLVDDSLRALADPTRRAILRLVRDNELPAGEIARHFHTISRPAVSQHLRVLTDAGLVEVRPDGNRRLYRGRREGLRDAAAFVQEMWASSLARLKVAVEREESPARAGSNGSLALPPETAQEEGTQQVTVDVTSEIVIDRPRDIVAAYAADPSNAPEWYDNIDSVEWKSAPAVAVGSRAAFVARFLGRRLEYTYELLDVVPGERLVMRTSQGPFPMETDYTFADADADAGADATHMTLRNHGEPHGFSRLVAPIMRPAMRRANRKDLAKLKSILESR